MKRIIILAMLVSCIACNKSDSNNNIEPNNSNSGNGNSNATENYFAITVDGEKREARGNHVQSSLYTSFNPKKIDIEVTHSSKDAKPFSIHIIAEKDGTELTGVYEYYQDTVSVNGTTYLYDDTRDVDNDSWVVKSATINLTTAEPIKYTDSVKIVGTFKLKLGNWSMNQSWIYKEVTGEFDSW